MIKCLSCHREMHQICAKYLVNVHGRFYCNTCRQQLSIKNISLRASILPETKFSSDVEEFLQPFLNSTTLAKKIFVRVLCDKLKIFTRQKEFQALAGPEKFFYRQRNLFVFYEMNDEDCCIFCIQMHLFGSDNILPNKNCAYISYIDSVPLINDSNLRTNFYKKLVLSVFKTLKFRGYQWLYLWSCPPKQGDDYIFVS